MSRTSTEKVLGLLVALALASGARAQDGERPAPAPNSVPVLLQAFLDDLDGLRADPVARPLEILSSPSVPRPADDRPEKGPALEGVTLFETRGAGALVRLWLDGDPGRVRIFLDGRGEPAFVFDAALVRSGELALMPPPLSGAQGRGLVARFPFPFRERLTVTVERPIENWSAAIRRWPDKVRVDPFDVKAAWGAMFAAEEGLARLAARLAPPPPGDDALVVTDRPTATLDLEPGAAAEIVALRAQDAPRALVRLALEDVVPFLEPGALDDLVLEVRVDGEETMALAASALFLESSSFEDLRTPAVTRETTHEGVARRRVARFVMPFAESLELRARNRGEAPLTDLRFTVEDVVLPAGAAPRPLRSSDVTARLAPADGVREVEVFVAPEGGASIEVESWHFDEAMLAASPRLHLVSGDAERLIAARPHLHFSSGGEPARGPDAWWTRAGSGVRLRRLDALPLAAGDRLVLRAGPGEAPATVRCILLHR